MRALVTGSRGFVGTWLVAHLRAMGDEVVAIDREVDVTDTAHVRQVVVDAAPDAVYHLAALAHVGRSWRDPIETVRVNVLGTLAVLEAAQACPGPPRVLLTSSAEVYGVVDPDDLPISESAPLAPATPYAASKVAAEYMAVQAHLGGGLPVVRARAFNHVGPGQSDAFVVPALAARIVAAARRGERSIPVGNLAARRDLTDVRDVVRAYRLLTERGEPGAVYNVCSGRDVPVSEIAERLLELAGADLELVVDPDLFRPVDLPVLRGDCSLLEKVTGWQPTFSLDRSLADILAAAR